MFTLSQLYWGGANGEPKVAPRGRYDLKKGCKLALVPVAMASSPSPEVCIVMMAKDAEVRRF